MGRHRPFRFGVLVTGAPSRAAWLDLVREVEDLIARRTQYGFSYIVVPGGVRSEFAPVVARLAGN